MNTANLMHAINDINVDELVKKSAEKAAQNAAYELTTEAKKTVQPGEHVGQAEVDPFNHRVDMAYKGVSTVLLILIATLPAVCPPAAFALAGLLVAINTLHAYDQKHNYFISHALINAFKKLFKKENDLNNIKNETVDRKPKTSNLSKLKQLFQHKNTKYQPLEDESTDATEVELEELSKTIACEFMRSSSLDTTAVSKNSNSFFNRKKTQNILDEFDTENEFQAKSILSR